MALLVVFLVAWWPSKWGRASQAELSVDLEGVKKSLMAKQGFERTA